MKKSDIEIGKEYAYQRNRNDVDSTYGIDRATVTGFTTSFNGSPMVQIEIHRVRWDYDIDENYRRIAGTDRKVEYRDARKVTLSTIVGEYEAEKTRREALQEKLLADRKESERLYEIRKQWKRDNYDPAMQELRAELAIITGKGYIHEDTKLKDFDLEQIQAITEALRKISVTA